jgi:hypothetical protein
VAHLASRCSSRRQSLPCRRRKATCPQSGFSDALRHRFDFMKSSRAQSPAAAATSRTPAPRTLPKKALERIHLGQSFAEYDTSLDSPSVFVQTPALQAASDPTNPHCFFVGRRGTGKTATTKFLAQNSDRVTIIRPEIFSPSSLEIPMVEFEKANQKPFRSLLAAFKRSLQD